MHIKHTHGRHDLVDLKAKQAAQAKHCHDKTIYVCLDVRLEGHAVKLVHFPAKPEGYRGVHDQDEFCQAYVVERECNDDVLDIWEEYYDKYDQARSQ